MSAAQRRELDLTRAWLERFVIGLNLCPFAAAPFQAGRILYQVSDAADDEGIYRDFLDLLERLLLADSRAVETALLIVSRGVRGFDDYLGLLDLLERALDQGGFSGVVQIASFHPDYRFDGESADDPANYTNRSPYPMFHLIREEQLAAALASYPDPAAIPRRNVERLRALGHAGIGALLAARDGATPASS